MLEGKFFCTQNLEEKVELSKEYSIEDVYNDNIIFKQKNGKMKTDKAKKTKGVDQSGKENVNITGRICKVTRELYTITYEDKSVQASLKGVFYKDKLDFPVIGDYVRFKPNPYGNAVIEEVLPRKTVFKRTDFSGHLAGYVKTVKEQILAANFDYVFIVTSLNQNYNENRIIRYISTSLKSGGKPIVILTKADLCKDPDTYVKKIEMISDKVTVYAVSSKTGAGIEQLKQYMQPGNTIALLGSSGVGKSTLVNTLAGCELMRVKEIRVGDDRGRHTTTHREMIQLPSGVYVIDTPGIRELGLYDVEEGIQETFEDIVKIKANCKFNNCTHNQEEGCAVRKAIEDNVITQERWNLYCNLLAENAWGCEKSVEE